MRYRPEIDGLRALAVVPVILFHAGFEAFSGGFLGVDVFFVISGYLITSLVIADLREGRFTLKSFYERRARRILPALLFVIAACIPFAWAWLLPAELEDFAKSVGAVLLFGSNLLFWRQSGYFSPASELQPLLHTWSLAVEEQYYMLFPLFLVLVWRFRREWLAATLIGITIFSLLLSEWANTRMPAAAFFLLPTRGWELLLGAIIALSPGLATHPKARQAKEVLAALGLVLLASAYFLIDRNHPLPGLLSLIPCLGASAVILFATAETWTGRMLARKPLVAVGLVSYSAYLWHQPLFAFTRHRIESPSAMLAASLVGSTFLLAYGSWKYVELPFRTGSTVSKRTTIAVCASGIAVLLSASIVTLLHSGFVQRFSPDERDLLVMGSVDYREALASYDLGKCFIDYHQGPDTLVLGKCITPRSALPKLVVFGDSKAAHLMTGVHKYLGGIFDVNQWTGTSCRPIIVHATKQRCADMYLLFTRDVVPTLREGDRVLIAGSWIDTAEDNQEEISGALKHLLRAIKASGADAVVVGNTPQFGQSPQNLVVKRRTRIEGAVHLRSKDIAPSDAIVQRTATEMGVVFAAPGRLLCKQDDPLMCRVYDGRQFLFSDSGHLSTAGSSLVVEAIARQILPAREQ